MSSRPRARSAGPRRSPGPASPSPTPHAAVADARLAEDGTDARIRWFRALLAACFLGSLTLSPLLWLTGRDYPLVPLLDGLPQPPPPADAVLLAAMGVSLVGAAVAKRPRRFLQAVLGIGALWALLDQTRWQPYFAYYLVAALCLLLAEGAEPRARRAWALAPFQLLVCCMYVYSGLHKLNHHYLTTDFRLTAAPVLRWLSLRPASLPASLAAGLALLSAALELGFGVLLFTPRLRRVAVVGLTLMHGFILASIGPLGQDYNRVVWPWNLAAIAALWLLFWPDGTGTQLAGFARAWRRHPLGGAAREKPDALPRPLALAWGAVLLVFGLLPALSFAGGWYASLSFQLYAGKERIALINYDARRQDALPPAALRAAATPGQVNLLAWSLAELGATPVLEDRVLLRIGRSLARRAPEANVAVIVGGPPALTTGERRTRYFVFPPPGFEPVDASDRFDVQIHEQTSVP